MKISIHGGLISSNWEFWSRFKPLTKWGYPARPNFGLNTRSLKLNLVFGHSHLSVMHQHRPGRAGRVTAWKSWKCVPKKEAGKAQR
jgi:hypothetical protein